MWLLFHRKAKTRDVRGGETFMQQCPDCHATCRFVEVEITEKLGMWFVDVAGDTSRAYRCTACDEVFDAKDEAREVATAPPAKSARELEIEQIKAELARRQHARVTEAKATKIEDELAELKKRLGK